jgi:hypothetical protein
VSRNMGTTLFFQNLLIRQTPILRPQHNTKQFLSLITISQYAETQEE